MPCDACLAGLHGIDGHYAIALDHREQRFEAPTFECRDCGERYVRQYEGGGSFAWMSVVGPPKP